MDDLISRQQAIDALETVGYDFSESELSEVELEEVCGAVGDVRQDMIGRIKRLPSAEPKRGRWHYSDGKPARIGLSFGVICDQCGTESEYCTNFCGECGADMRQKGEDNESN